MGSASNLPEAFVTGSLNLVLARCALELGDVGTARQAVERAALSATRTPGFSPTGGERAAWALARSRATAASSATPSGCRLVCRDGHSAARPAPSDSGAPSARQR